MDAKPGGDTWKKWWYTSRLRQRYTHLLTSMLGLPTVKERSVKWTALCPQADLLVVVAIHTLGELRAGGKLWVGRLGHHITAVQ